jgi:ACR3 family arsenite efflux pump ArsB
LNKKKKGFLCLALCLILTVSFGMQGLRVIAQLNMIFSDIIPMDIQFAELSTILANISY